MTTPIQKSKNLNFSAFEEEISLVEQHTEATATNEKDPIAIDDANFEESWKKYIQFLIDDGNAGLATSFEGIQYTISTNIILLEIASASIEELIRKNRSILVDFFRRELNNETIDLETRINENAQQINIKSLSSREKLNDMMQRNPSIAKLIQELGLELEL